MQNVELIPTNLGDEVSSQYLEKHSKKGMSNCYISTKGTPQ